VVGTRRALSYGMSNAAKMMKRVTAAIKGAALSRDAILATAANITAKAQAEFAAGNHACAEELHVEAECYTRAAA